MYLSSLRELMSHCCLPGSVEHSDKTMSCEGCSNRFTILKRRKTCQDCSHDYCADCVLRTKGFDRKYQCNRCHVFATVPLDRSAVTRLKVKDLRWFLVTKAVPIVGCKEKTDLVELIMQYSSHSTAQSAYPLNYKRHTAIPELINHRRNSAYESSPSPTPDATGHIPGPSGADSIPSTSKDEAATPNPDSTVMPSAPQENSQTSQDDTEHVSGPTTEGSSVISENIDVGNISKEQTEETKRCNDNPRDYQTISLESVESLEQIYELTVMQLKVLLTRNFVAYQGCCEKSELQEKVRWLWKQRQAAKNVENVPDENLCKICMEASIDSVLLDCGHMVTCTQCGKLLHECPICRQIIVRVVHTFQS